MTTWVGRKPAISSASWSATEQLSTTAAMSATVPDCMWDRPCRLRPTPRTVPRPVVVDLEDERLGELGADVEGRAGGERRDVVALPDAAPEGHLARPRAPSGRSASALERVERRQSPRAACPCPGPSRAARRPCRRSPRRPDERRRRTPRAPTRSSLTVTNSCGSSASRPSAMTPDPGRARGPPWRRSSAHRSTRTGRRRRRAGRPGASSSARLASSAGRGRPPRPPALSRRFASRSSSWSARDPLRRSHPSTSRRRSAARSSVANRAREGVRARARHRLDAAHARADAPLPGDDEAADLAGRAAVGPAAQLVAVALDPDGPHLLAVLLVEERVGARRRSPRPSSGTRRSPAGRRGRSAGPRPRSRRSVVGQRPVEREVEAQVVGGHQRARPGGPRSPTTLRSARCRRCVPVWLRIVRARRSASTTASPSRRRASGRGASRGGR